MDVTGLDVSNRIHVAPVGYERDRVVLPAVRLDADRVVLLVGGGDDSQSEYASGVRDDLDDAGIPHETVPCDVFDLYDAIGAVAELATARDDDDVFVNLASGSKVTAIGGMIACMATGATPYYVRAERYGDATESGVSEGVAEISRLPTYPIDRPERQHVAVLDYLAESGPTPKRDLIAFGERADLPFLDTYESDAPRGKYRLLDSRVLDPLREQGLVAVESVGRQKRARLTTDGENALRAFEYLLE